MIFYSVEILQYHMIGSDLWSSRLCCYRDYWAIGKFGILQCLQQTFGHL